MSNKLRIKLIIVLAICMLACTIAGCSIGMQTYDEFLEEKNIVSQVTYYGNGGYFSSNTAILSVEISYTTGSMIYTPEEGTSANYMVTRDKYDLVSWYNVEQRTYTETNDEGEDEDVLYFVLDITDEELASLCASNSKITAYDGGYYFEYTSELTTGTEDDEDEDEDEDTSEVEFDEDDEYDASYLTNRMYYVKDSDGEWIMSQEDYDYYVRLRKEYNTDTTISVPNLKYGEEMDSKMILEDGVHLYMVADWVKSVSINYYLAMKDGETATSINITVSNVTSTIEIGGLLYQEYFGTQTSITRTDAGGLPSSVKFDDATLLAFYYDAECTQPVNGESILKPEEDEFGNLEDVIIYAQCIAGIYTVVRDADGVVDMFSDGSGSYYVFSDIDVNPDLADDEILYTVSPYTTFSGEIRGNGYTISNLYVTKSSISGTAVALFGQLREGAKITDLTFDKMKIEYQTSSVQAVNIYLVGLAAQNATSIDITGLTIKNAEMYITLAERSNSEYTYLRNMQYQSESDTYESDNYLYGDMDDYANDYGINYADEEFETTYGGANIESCTIYVREGIEYDQSGDEIDTYVVAITYTQAAAS